MEVYSFFEQSFQLKPTRIEISLIPGLPEFKVTGLPDSSMKESLLRIRSALVTQGFELPKTHQVIINLTPAFEKKTSKGLELAIACAYLWRTEQAPIFHNKLYVYGELGLNGEVHFLPELNWLDEREDIEVLTGESTDFLREHLQLKQLIDLKEPPFQSKSQKINPKMSPPIFTKVLWSKSVARAMSVIATGHHHSLIAGPAGSGKSTFNFSMAKVLPPKQSEDLYELRRWNRVFGADDLNKNPVRQPHHTSTIQAIMGGGRPIVPGEVTRAHHGLLIMDEFLEFPNAVREALREPMETGEIHISRQAQKTKLPANFLLLASTNLCPCGNFVPKDMSVKCRFSLKKCNSYLERLSGPIADRFDILLFSNDWGRAEEVSESEVFDAVQRAKSFQHKMGRKTPNSSRSYQDLAADFDGPQLEKLMPSEGKSRRRNQSLLRVARSLADLELSEKIKAKHIQEAMGYAWQPFQTLNEPLL